MTSQQLTSVPVNYNQIIYHNYFQLICPLSLSWLMSCLNFDHMLKGVFSSPTTEVCLKESRDKSACRGPQAEQRTWMLAPTR